MADTIRESELTPREIVCLEDKTKATELFEKRMKKEREEALSIVSLLSFNQHDLDIARVEAQQALARWFIDELWVDAEEVHPKLQAKLVELQQQLAALKGKVGGEPK